MIDFSGETAESKSSRSRSHINKPPLPDDLLLLATLE